MSIVLQGVIVILAYSLMVTGFIFGVGIVATKNKWNFKLALAISFFISFFALAVIIWLGIHETWVLVFGLFCAVLAGVGVYTWPRVMIDSLKTLFNKWARLENREE